MRDNRPDDGLSPEAAQEILSFLDGAPESIRVWADSQAEAARARIIAAPGAVTSAPSSPETEESEDFFNDMEGEDDVLHGRLNKRASGVPAGKIPVGARWALALVLALGIGGGIWWAGQPSKEPAATPPATMGQETPSASESAARIAELEQAVAASPEDVDAHLELGVLYFNLADVEGAKKQWLAVTELAPENITAWYNLGFAYLSSTPADMEAAQAAWQRVIDLDPDSDLASTVSMHLSGLGGSQSGVQ